MEKTNIILFDIDDTLFNTDVFKQSNRTVFSLYDDVIPTLEKLKTMASLGIFSQSDDGLQKIKLRETKIDHFFEEMHTHISKDKIGAIQSTLSRYDENQHVFFVEDKLPVLVAVKKAFPSVFTVWIKQGRYAPKQEPIEGFSPDAEINNIAELVPLIQNVQTK